MLLCCICPSRVCSPSSCSIKTLVAEIENADVEAFTEAVKSYDSISRLDTWYTTMLLRVKKAMSEPDDLR